MLTSKAQSTGLAMGPPSPVSSVQSIKKPCSGGRGLHRGVGTSQLSRSCSSAASTPAATPALSTSPRSVRRQRSVASQASAAGLAAPVTLSARLEQYDFGFSAAQGLRDTMEDEVVAFVDQKNKRMYAGVFDGHCGSHAAAWLKDELYTLLSTHLPKGGLHLPVGSVATTGLLEGSAGVDGTTGAFGPALTRAFLEADRTLIAHLAKLGGDLAVEGSTATAVVITPGDSIVVAHVGDSQAVLCRDGRAMALATPHRVTGVTAAAKAEIARIKAGGGWIDDGRVCGFLAVSRALGDCEYKGAGLAALVQKGVDYGFWDEEFAAKQRFTADPVVALPAVSETPMTAGDELLLLASDGLWDVMSPADAVRWARQALKAKKSAAEVAEGLVELAIKRHSADNISVAVVDFVGQEYWNPPAGPLRGGKPGPMAAGMGFFGKMFGGK